jgi:hypothetical protein
VVREPHPSESGAIAALLNAEAEARHGEGDVTAATIEEWFGYDEVDLRVVEEGGALVAYGDIGRSADETKAWFDVREHPEHPGAAEPLWPVLEDLAGEGVIHRAIVAAGDESLRGQLARRGYRPIRSSYRMLIELDGEVVAETTGARLLCETNLPMRFYVPREDVRAELRRSPSRS